jgi:hypothetical protein
MPTVYRIERSEGSEQSGIDPCLGGQVTFDGKRTGTVVTAEYQALLIGDEIKPLAHPLETSALKAFKQTYLSASLSGILLHVERRICLRCGHVFGIPRIVFSGAAGCLPTLLISLATVALLRFMLGTATGASLFAAMATLIVVDCFFRFAGAVYIRVRFSKRQETVHRLECPACGSIDSVAISSVLGKRVQIGNEGKWVEVSIAGRA